MVDVNHVSPRFVMIVYPVEVIYAGEVYQRPRALHEVLKIHLWGPKITPGSSYA